MLHDLADTDLTFDPQPLLRLLNKHEVEFIVIGGVAVMAYGCLRATRDIDIVPKPTRSNFVKLAKALEELEAKLIGVDAHLLDDVDLDAPTLARGANFPVETIYGQLDILQETHDINLYELVSKEPVHVTMDGVSVYVCSLSVLRKLKQLAARPRDLADLDELEEVTEETT